MKTIMTAATMRARAGSYRRFAIEATIAMMAKMHERTTVAPPPTNMPNRTMPNPPRILPRVWGRNAPEAAEDGRGDDGDVVAGKDDDVDEADLAEIVQQFLADGVLFTDNEAARE